MTRVLSLLAACLLSCRCQAREAGTAPAQYAPAPVQLSMTSTETTMNCPRILTEARRDGDRPGTWVTPNEVELRAIEVAISSLIAGAGDEARAAAAEAGFAVVDIPEWPGTSALVENGKLRGGGAYVVRRGSTSKVVVQTPHTFFDEGTFALGCALFERAHARALFLNTVHRYKAAPAGAADVAHAEESSFQRATIGALRSIGPATVVQLHGFVDERDRFAAGTTAVVSSGSNVRGKPDVERVARALGGTLGGGVLRFPDDTRELGATTNVQGKVVRAAGGTFVHVEMSAATRRLLLEDPTRRDATFTALIEAMERSR
jgi:hypothetical protein